MHAAIESTLAAVLTREASLEWRRVAVVEAVLWSAVAAAHGLGMLATVAACFDLYRARLTLAWMTSLSTGMDTAVQLLAARIAA